VSKPLAVSSTCDEIAMLRWCATSLIAACALSALARTELAEKISTQPISQVASWADAAALALQGISNQRRTRLGSIERVADFGADDPIRKIAHSIGMIWVHTTGSDGKASLYSCTAAVIALNRIITNQHCVRKPRLETVTKIVLWLDHTELAIANNFNVEIQPLEADEALDYAILALTQVVSSPAAQPLATLAFRDAVPGERLMIIHHSSSEPQQITRAFCRAVSTQPSTDNDLAHTCATSPGSSGALVFAERDGAIVGLHKSIQRGRDRSPGYATPSLALLAKSTILKAAGASKKIAAR
jgi:V8-like Glu-specific endopeptidase